MKEGVQLTRNHGRATGHRQLSISIPIAIVQHIDEIAFKERRSRSAMICIMLEAEIAYYERTHLRQPISLVAEPNPEQYGKAKAK